MEAVLGNEHDTGPPGALLIADRMRTVRLGLPSPSRSGSRVGTDHAWAEPRISSGAIDDVGAAGGRSMRRRKCFCEMRRCGLSNTASTAYESVAGGDGVFCTSVLNNNYFCGEGSITPID